MKEDPWLKIEEKYQAGQKVKGRVLKIRPNTVFVELPGDPEKPNDYATSIVGVIPVSELGENPSEILEEGKEYDLTIVNLDPIQHKLSLTLNKPAVSE